MARVSPYYRGKRIKKVSVSLNEMIAADQLPADLFGDLPEMWQRKKWERISRTLDRLNHRFGRDTVSLGMLPEEGRRFSDSKIAFTRIPQLEEFLE